MKVVLVFIFVTLSLCANENPMMLLPWGIGFIVALGIFFWGIYKTIKTQKMIYMLALLPIFFLITGMFFI
jgi:hypothetical protein